MKVLEALERYKGSQLEKLEALKEQYAIKFNICGDLVSLKYDQLDSPKTNPVVCECRGLVLELDTFKVVVQQFHRFFNYGEESNVSEDDLSKMVIQEKHDGSLMSLYFHDGEWKCCTSGNPTAQSHVGELEITFADLFWEALGKKDINTILEEYREYTFTFELTAPQNKVVRTYGKPALVLLGARFRQKELTPDYIEELSELLNVELPTMYNLNTLDKILDSWKVLRPDEEGYVAVDYSKRDAYGNFLRCKIKNPAYVALHRLKDSSCNSQRALLQVVLMGEVDEVITYFPEYTDVIRSFESSLKNWREAHNELAARFMSSHPAEIGIFCKNNSYNSSVIFAITRKQCVDADDYIRRGVKKKGIKGFAKKFLVELKTWE